MKCHSVLLIGFTKLVWILEVSIPFDFATKGSKSIKNVYISFLDPKLFCYHFEAFNNATSSGTTFSKNILSWFKPDEIIGKAHFDESSIVISPVMTHRSDNSLSDFNKTLCGTFETISIHL